MKKEKTREVITDSLYGLLKRHSFSKITVPMICEASGISKATFYRHFYDKYDVMNAFFQIRCEKLIADNPGTMNCLKFLKEYAALVSTYKDYFRAVMTMEGQNSFQEFLLDFGQSYYIDNIERETGERISEELRIEIELFTAGTVYVTRRWVEKETAFPADELAELVFNAMPGGMMAYYHK